MTKKQIAAIAVAYYLSENNLISKTNENWIRTGRNINMYKRTVVQSKGNIA